MDSRREGLFWAKVNKTDGCWLWTASKTKPGYGKFSVEHQVWRFAHRVSWQLAYGDIPDGMCVLHRCDTPECVRPEHLFLGTNADNTSDMMRKGRHKGGKRADANTQARLSWQQVEEIRRRYDATKHLLQTDPRRVTMNQLQAEFGVGHTTIFHIVHGLAWKREWKRTG